MVVRTEHLWEDLQGIESILGGGTINKEDYKDQTHGSEQALKGSRPVERWYESLMLLALR
jgi:hypothetical protein